MTKENAVEAVADAVDTNEDGKTVIRPDLEKYQKARTASGAMSHHSGDIVATNLAGMTVEETAEVAVALTGATDLATKYSHLNVGQQRMNLGNRIRGGIANIDKENTKTVAAAVKEAGEGADADEIAEELNLQSGETKFLAIVTPMREAVDARVAEAEKAKEAAAAERKAKAEEKAKAKAAKAEKAEAEAEPEEADEE